MHVYMYMYVSINFVYLYICIYTQIDTNKNIYICICRIIFHPWFWTNYWQGNVRKYGRRWIHIASYGIEKKIRIIFKRYKFMYVLNSLMSILTDMYIYTVIYVYVHVYIYVVYICVWYICVWYVYIHIHKSIFFFYLFNFCFSIVFPAVTNSKKLYLHQALFDYNNAILYLYIDKCAYIIWIFIFSFSSFFYSFFRGDQSETAVLTSSTIWLLQCHFIKTWNEYG
jgi:hypothetical protein